MRWHLLLAIANSVELDLSLGPASTSLNSLFVEVLLTGLSLEQVHARPALVARRRLLSIDHSGTQSLALNGGHCFSHPPPLSTVPTEEQATGCCYHCGASTRGIVEDTSQRPQLLTLV